MDTNEFWMGKGLEQYENRPIESLEDVALELAWRNIHMMSPDSIDVNTYFQGSESTRIMNLHLGRGRTPQRVLKSNERKIRTTYMKLADKDNSVELLEYEVGRHTHLFLATELENEIILAHSYELLREDPFLQGERTADKIMGLEPKKYDEKLVRRSIERKKTSKPFEKLYFRIMHHRW